MDVWLKVLRHQILVGKCIRRSFTLTLFSDFQIRKFASSSVHLALTNKTRAPIKFKEKSKIAKIKIYNNMTVADIAQASERNINVIFDIIDKFVKETNVSKFTQIELSITKDIIKRLGLRSVVVPSPNKITKASPNLDAYPRGNVSGLNQLPRPPIVTIMGHVDHGKTTLLDSLRSTNVVSQEFGGITQHIGAFSVESKKFGAITFLDTPGHAAFSAMRARGARITDIVVLVVAADDGVMEQTIESIRYAREANVPMLVAINKCDKPMANPADTKKLLLMHGVQVEELGGDVQAIEISALKRTNLDLLLESISTLSEILEIKAPYEGPVEGAIIEARADNWKGKLATVLVQKGTLQVGDYLVSGFGWAKVRAMVDNDGKKVKKATPSSAVEVLGWRYMPSAGDIVLQVESEVRAKEVIAYRNEQTRKKRVDEIIPEVEKRRSMHHLEYSERRSRNLQAGIRSNIYRKERTKEVITSYDGPECCILIKADVHGSLEAILDIIHTYRSKKCKLSILDYGVGLPKTSEVELAGLFNGIIYLFNLRLSDEILTQANESGVVIKEHNIIYKLLDDLRMELTKRLPEEQYEEVLGEAEVLQNFDITVGRKKVPVIGARCTKGSMNKEEKFRLIRNSVCIHEGPLTSMRHFKNEVKSIKKDVECGIRFEETKVAAKAGDSIECFTLKLKPGELDWKLSF